MPNGDKIIAPKRHGGYLADPYYRFVEDDNVVEEYIYNCTVDFEYAKNAFFRICLLYLKNLFALKILPSFSFDVFREELNNQKRMIEIPNRMDELKKKKEAASTAPVTVNNTRE